MENNEEQLHIVFGNEHYNPLGIIRSLGESGIDVIAIIKKANVRISSKSKYIKKLHMVDTIEEGYKILKDFYSGRKLKPYIYTSDDTITSFLDNRYDELKDDFIFFNAGANGRITKYMNKKEINELAVSCGLNIPKSWIIESKDAKIPKDIEYPVVTKAIISTIDNWKSDAFICKNATELKDVCKNMRSEKLLVQEYIAKKNELCLDGYSAAKGKKVFYAIASNYINIIENCYSNYLEVKNTYDKDVEKKLNKMFAKIGFEGIFSVEFLIDKNDKLYFLEINFRNSTWSYASTKAGMNLPLLWSKAMKDSSVVDNSYKSFEPFLAITELNDYKDRVKTHQITFFKWLKQLRECGCLFITNKKDNAPMRSIIKYRVISKFKRIFKRK